MKVGMNAFAAAAVEIRCNLSSFTSRSWLLTRNTLALSL
jgi:hypothetical protein